MSDTQPIPTKVIWIGPDMRGHASREQLERDLIDRFTEAIGRARADLADAFDRICPAGRIVEDGAEMDAIWLVEIGQSQPPVFAFLEREWQDDPELIEYLVEEGTCPSNLLGFRVHWSDARNPDDPHGVLTFIQQIRRPDDWETTGDRLSLFDMVPDYLADGPPPGDDEDDEQDDWNAALDDAEVAIVGMAQTLGENERDKALWDAVDAIRRCKR